MAKKTRNRIIAEEERRICSYCADHKDCVSKKEILAELKKEWVEEMKRVPYPDENNASHEATETFHARYGFNAALRACWDVVEKTLK